MDKYHKEVSQTKNLNIHNDIDSAAGYLTQRVREKVEAGVTDALTFDCMAAGTMIAFAFEAYLNVMSEKLIGAWNERGDLHSKIGNVFQRLKIAPDWSKRPYSSISAMKRLRDTLAHGKPEKVETKTTVVDKADGPKGKKVELSGEWERLCSPTMIMNAYDDLEAVWKDMVQASGIDIMDLITSGEGSVTVGERFVPPKSQPKKIAASATVTANDKDSAAT